MMEKLGKMLNLKPRKNFHLLKKLRILDYVGNGDIISTPVDIEVHRGLDQKLYALDFSRLFPPEAVSKGHGPNSYLYCLLRPEFVLSYPKPLCSDAYG
jgi:hypothetical protein